VDFTEKHYELKVVIQASAGWRKGCTAGEPKNLKNLSKTSQKHRRPARMCRPSELSSGGPPAGGNLRPSGYELAFYII